MKTPPFDGLKRSCFSPDCLDPWTCGRRLEQKLRHFWLGIAVCVRHEWLSGTVEKG